MSLSVNSDYSTLVAAHTLGATMGRISETMRQLSTGTAVTPRSDPASFIAGTLMESEMLAAQQVAKNAQMSNAVLSIAESGMGQITNLLQEANTLSVAAANTGALTPDMVNAYQLQMDGILGSVNRIARSTNYLGTPLLDGSYTAKVAQLGTNVVPSQQATISIPDMSTASLGGKQGNLYQLASGEAASLASNPALASSILNTSLGSVLNTRADIGATQKYTLDMTQQFMEDYMTQLAGVRSLIMDTDFAIATSNLARDSLLAQTCTKALGLATRPAEYAASLLMG
jgi:flagellin